MTSSKHPARLAALTAMGAVTGEGMTLDQALGRGDPALSDAQRAEARRLATAAFRFASRSDRLTGPRLRRTPEDRVLDILRLALAEHFAEGAPAHAVVDAAVDLTPRRMRGLVNAVLRGILRDAPDWDAVPNPTPRWLRKRLVAAWGEDATRRIESVHAVKPPVDITPHRSPLPADAVPLPTGSLRLHDAGRLSGLPGYAEGAWWVQDAAAALPVRLLGDVAGRRVLDLCAAPGGKTMQLAAAGARVTALDISEARLARLHENLARTGLSADIVAADVLEWAPSGRFDAVLLDAPCSATGTLRRHPDLPFAGRGEVIGQLVDLQRRMLDRALSWVETGGALIYCTCSLLPEEGEAQVAHARAARWRVDLPDPPWIEPVWQVEQGLRIRPDHWAERGGIDGFFITRLVRGG